MLRFCLPLTVLMFVAGTSRPASAQKPNFIVILTDDQGFEDYGYLQPLLETPNMDKLVNEGVQFTRFYTTASCSPTRSQLMTGRHFMRTGTASAGYGGEAPHLDEYLLSEAMKDAGYVTGMVGKWALGNSDADLPFNRGFDETWVLGQENERHQGRYTHVNPSFWRNGSWSGVENGWQVELVTDKAINFIESHKAEPFFLYLPYSQPHEPWLCPKPLQNKYIEKGASEFYAMFLGMMEQLDIQIGRLFRTLEKNGLSENTVFFFFGDNGPTEKTRILRRNEKSSRLYVHTGTSYELNETEWSHRNPSGLRGDKASGWENGVRNRLSIYCPAMFSPKAVPNMTLTMDIYPTVLALAGSERKTEAPPLDGLSLEPFLMGNPSFWPNNRGYLSGHPGNPRHSWPPMAGLTVLPSTTPFPCSNGETFFVQGGWVIVNRKGDFRLYNVLKDPQQKKNLSRLYPEKFRTMNASYFGVLHNIRQDPHAWSAPVQLIGIPGFNEVYVAWEYIFRAMGKFKVDRASTRFLEVGSIQQVKVDVLATAAYNIRLYAERIPRGTKIRLRIGEVASTVVLSGDVKYNNIGQRTLMKGRQVMSITLLDCDEAEKTAKNVSLQCSFIKGELIQWSSSQQGHLPQVKPD